MCVAENFQCIVCGKGNQLEDRMHTASRCSWVKWGICFFKRTAKYLWINYHGDGNQPTGKWLPCYLKNIAVIESIETIMRVLDVNLIESHMKIGIELSLY